jgi:uncharacterized coiled-coil DUF342 family protein
MKKLFQQATQLMKEAEDINKDLFAYSPGSKCKKVPLRNIQYSIASLMREYSRLYAEIGEKIRNDS